MIDRFKPINKLERIERIKKVRPILSLVDTIKYCINKGYKLDFLYEDEKDSGNVLTGYRGVAPAAVGIHTSTGNEVLRAYLMQGVSKSQRSPYWRLFRLDRIKVYNIHFSKTKVGSNKLYRQDDKHMSQIFTEVKR